MRSTRHYWTCSPKYRDRNHEVDGIRTTRRATGITAFASRQSGSRGTQLGYQDFRRALRSATSSRATRGRRRLLCGGVFQASAVPKPLQGAVSRLTL